MRAVCARRRTTGERWPRSWCGSVVAVLSTGAVLGRMVRVPPRSSRGWQYRRHGHGHGHEERWREMSLECGTRKINAIAQLWHRSSIKFVISYVDM